MAISEFKLSKTDIGYVGEALSRPECIIAERDGTLWVSDDRGGATRIGRDGRQSTIGSIPGLPNGLALDADGSLLVAEIDHGKFYRLQRDGRHQLLADNAGGKPLGSLNFVYRDPAGRIWLTISTHTVPRRDAIDKSIPDGAILRYDNGKLQVAAEGIYFANEVRVDRAGRYLYVAESGKGRVRRMPIAADGSLGAGETYGPEQIFPGAIVDGIAFDADGNLWVTEVSRNGLYVITPEGQCHCVFQDPSGETLQFPASITFGGADLRTAYIGSIRMNRLGVFRSPVAGEPLVHWNDRVA